MINQILRRISGQVPIQDEQSALVALYHRRYEIALFEERYDSAMVFLDRILEVQPRRLETRISRARLFETIGNSRRAIDAYLRVLPFAEQEDPAAASIVRESLDRLLGNQKTTGSSEGTISTDETAEESSPSILTEPTVTLPTESQNPFPAGTIAHAEETRPVGVPNENPPGRSTDSEPEAIFSPERRTA